MTVELEHRVVELETRLAFQEQAMAELSDALAEARRESARNSDRIRQMLDEMKQSSGDSFADHALEPPPPHY